MTRRPKVRWRRLPGGGRGRRRARSDPCVVALPSPSASASSSPQSPPTNTVYDPITTKYVSS
ncbi:hypothetical protein NEUTE1DRAFT_117617 [Neurospora tetrasperma FGSC 2508]|uniref:Uncharacterized protein n=1 Tax=Neurospora tetrasperma (strain FGSC 2508 / ATCC MYA-4615 / P0657) TaxID=510951 RepID=F8MRX0_NEUT8|nr:uncharacterized protein NEUTE1DRAFT_117617 [Neurospora tetrasperma FGSC 2508]EGO54964.1 hypothetical protein NEUTE1DRAFT_117617 [Neurospora tetrasperma FGSC 2508]EGZ69845.1 hypothetical protein NEUTE2DRAFT_145674 [Neurospora tetrasperma FGSC 2509]